MFIKQHEELKENMIKRTEKRRSLDSAIEPPRNRHGSVECKLANATGKGLLLSPLFPHYFLSFSLFSVLF